MASRTDAATPVAVITGGASGFGLALGNGCAAKGMTVVLLDLDGERAEGEAEAVAAAHGVDALGLGVNVADTPTVSSAAATVAARFGRADLVISNVGVQLFGSNDRLTDDEWHWVLDVNVVGSARVARAFVPLLRQAGLSRLAFTASTSVLDPASRMAAYQTSKFAVWGLAETLRRELANDGIGVSVIFPSGMLSRHLETSAAAQPDHLRRPIGDEDDFAAMIASNPSITEGVITPEEAAQRALDGLLAKQDYIVTHGDFVHAIDSRCTGLRQAAEAARNQQ
jgi:NAD(P)-dependent dehydrogenase (short-subunit alcohol dehydrogenase family)